jgi:hypothetical protein
MIRLQDVPRHKRQSEFEAIFCLGPKELLLKTYSASWQQSLGKLWISTSAASFSGGGNKRQVVHFCDVREVRSGGFRTIVFVLVDNSVFEISSLWHKDECFMHLSSLWWNSARPARSSASPVPTVELDDVVLVGNTADRFIAPLTPGSKSPTTQVPLTAETMVGQALDDLDEVADLLLLSAIGNAPAPSCDYYGFPLQELEVKYKEFVTEYMVEQDKMRKRWFKFLQKRSVDRETMLLVDREEVLTLLLRGVPPELRPSVYFRVSGARRKRGEAEPGYYAALKAEVFGRH